MDYKVLKQKLVKFMKDYVPMILEPVRTGLVEMMIEIVKEEALARKEEE